MTLCKGKASVFVTDFLYVFIVSLNLFIFSVAYMLGFFRVFVTVGSFLGFVICRLTLGRLLSLVYCPMIRFTESVCVKISQKIKKNLKKLLKNSNNILYNEGKNKGHLQSLMTLSQRLELHTIIMSFILYITAFTISVLLICLTSILMFSRTDFIQKRLTASQEEPLRP